jgi:hypothetical protein
MLYSATARGWITAWNSFVFILRKVNEIWPAFIFKEGHMYITCICWNTNVKSLWWHMHSQLMMRGEQFSLYHWCLLLFVARLSVYQLRIANETQNLYLPKLSKWPDNNSKLPGTLTHSWDLLMMWRLAGCTTACFLQTCKWTKWYFNTCNHHTKTSGKCIKWKTKSC